MLVQDDKKAWLYSLVFSYQVFYLFATNVLADIALEACATSQIVSFAWPCLSDLVTSQGCSIKKWLTPAFIISLSTMIQSI